MTDAADALRRYLDELRANLAQGNATEHTHRPALKTLLEAVGDDVVATNEPSHIAVGAPDFVVSRTGGARLTIGYVEAKDVGADLGAIERDSNRARPTTPNGEQIKRYRENLPNLLLTNYTEFRWYVDGERRLTAQLAAPNARGRLAGSAEAAEATEQLLGAFLRHSLAPVANAEELARRMAQITRMLRDVVRREFESGTASAPLRDFYAASESALTPGQEHSEFADMFAQTLAYGLFAARVNERPGTFRRETAAHRIPAANPFLQTLFNTVAGPGIKGEPYVGSVDDLAELLDNADMSEVLADFGKRGALQDPILHFYETFLAVYDPTQRERRGVYYTPDPVVSYIVRSVDLLLRDKFGLREGLGDYSEVQYSQDDGDGNIENKRSHRVLILDPACGTGTFLYAVIDLLRERFFAGNNAGLWNTSYIRECLLPRLFGFELLMAPYAMAHLKLGMQLGAMDMPKEHRSNWGYQFMEGERLGVYLTNALEQEERQVQAAFGPMRAIADEANAASGIKRDLPIMVVLGNPPYSGHSANASWRNGKRTWIGRAIEDYKRVDGKPLGERNPKWLQDDYVKFIRFGQWRIEQSGGGVLAFITNHAYLDNPTFRGMRQRLMETFTDIYLLDLHGNARAREVAPDGGPDQNVFDIQQGVAIALFVKEPGKSGPAQVRHADLRGARQAKYDALAASDVATTQWEHLAPASPNYLFKPWDTTLEEEYRQWPSVTEMMPVNSVGVVTARDDLTLRWTREDAFDVARDFASLSPDAARRRYRLPRDSKDWSAPLAQQDVKNSGVSENLVAPIQYRAFDVRYTYYTGASNGFLCRPRPEVMRHMLANGRRNLALIACRQQSRVSEPWNLCGVSDTIIEACAISNITSEINSLFPLYLYPAEQETEQGLSESGSRRANLSPECIASLEEKTGMRFIADGRGDLQATFGPEDAFHYVYAVLHAPSYRERYDQFLRADFPRVPPPTGAPIFRALAQAGAALTAEHLLQESALDISDLGFPIAGNGAVEKGYPRYYPPGESVPGEDVPLKRGRVYVNDSDLLRQGQYFEGIEPEAWAFRLGSFQPLEKWLRDRVGRPLSHADQQRYMRMAAALRDTVRLMGEVDAAIAAHGGLWGERDSIEGEA